MKRGNILQNQMGFRSSSQCLVRSFTVTICQVLQDQLIGLQYSTTPIKVKFYFMVPKRKTKLRIKWTTDYKIRKEDLLSVEPYLSALSPRVTEVCALASWQTATEVDIKYKWLKEVHNYSMALSTLTIQDSTSKWNLIMSLGAYLSELKGALHTVAIFLEKLFVFISLNGKRASSAYSEELLELCTEKLAFI